MKLLQRLLEHNTVMSLLMKSGLTGRFFPLFIFSFKTRCPVSDKWQIEVCPSLQWRNQIAFFS